MPAKSSNERWHEWRQRVVSNTDQYEVVKQRQREQKRKERARFKVEASEVQLQARREADRERQRRRRARLRTERLKETAGNEKSENNSTEEHIQMSNKFGGSLSSVSTHHRSTNSGKHKTKKIKGSGTPMKIKVGSLITSSKAGHASPSPTSKFKHSCSTSGSKKSGTGVIALKKTPYCVILSDGLKKCRYVFHGPDSSGKEQSFVSSSSHSFKQQGSKFPSTLDMKIQRTNCTGPKCSYVMDSDVKHSLTSLIPITNQGGRQEPPKMQVETITGRRKSRKQAMPIKYVPV